MGYLRIATHPAIFESPLSPEEAIANVDALLSRPNVQAPGEGERFWRLFLEVAEEALPRGNLVPDAHLVVLMRENGVRTLWSHDRASRRFPGTLVRDPCA
jgi:toxin-antitoxin system PIN domain toxin